MKSFNDLQNVYSNSIEMMKYCITRLSSLFEIWIHADFRNKNHWIKLKV